MLDITHQWRIGCHFAKANLMEMTIIIRWVLTPLAEAFGLILYRPGLVIFRHLPIPQQLPCRLCIETEHPGRAIG
jgi:hypothetical protein